MSEAQQPPDPCERPGCTGDYEDMGSGELYCDTCGLAPANTPRSTPENTTETTPDPTPEPAPAPCQRPGCTGDYEDMGSGELYCDTCGLAPVLTPDGALGAAPTSLTAAARHGSGSARSRTSRTSAASVESAGTDTDGDASASSAGLRGTSGRSERQATTGRPSRSLSVEDSDSGHSARQLSVHGSDSGDDGRSRGHLGLGLISVPKVPRPDPSTVVLENPEVPERKRFCGNTACGARVGRTLERRPGRAEGFCTKCGHPYSFVPRLRPGEVVHGQYEVAGCLAHGGLGWVYLAIDRAVSDRWVVLKGLLDTRDEDAMAAAIFERRFLAEIEHPNIVQIYNFVEHPDRRTGTMDGYIVMEYVGGKSLKQLANARRTPEGRREPLPVEQACAYGLEALEALSHLHNRSLVYCDFKVDNAIQQGDQLKLIDLGAVRRLDDEESAIYGTVGYQAPEVARSGPSVASDLYTVARTLAVLTFDFRGYTNIHADSLPDPENVAVFRQFESFYRFLVRATDPDPRRRFASAAQMSEQLTGVLREVVALRTGRPRPAMSSLFGPELRVVDSDLLTGSDGDTSTLGRQRGRSARPARIRRAVTPGAKQAKPPVSARRRAGPRATSHEANGHASAPATVQVSARVAALALPVPKVDPDDPAAGYLAALQTATPAELSSVLPDNLGHSIERQLREVRAHLEQGAWKNIKQATATLEELESRHPDDWRVIWHRGLYGMVARRPQLAAAAFEAVYAAHPGEPATKLALACCAEALEQLDNAAEYYRLVWSTDPTYVGAAFGLARVRLKLNDRMGAVAVLESVPEASIHFFSAQAAAIRARLRNRSPVEPLHEELHTAAGQIERLRTAGLDALREQELTAVVLGSALDWTLAGGHTVADTDEVAGDAGSRSTDGQSAGTVTSVAAASRTATAHASGPSGGSARQPDPVVHDPARPSLLGSPMNEQGLRQGLEHAYRQLARLAQTSTERIDMVERANRFRPRTWV